MGFWDIGMLIFFLDVVVVTARLTLEIAYWTGIELLCIGFSLGPVLWGLWFLFSSDEDLDIIGLLSSYRIYGTYQMLFETGFFWCTILLSTVICLIPIFV